MAPKWFSKVPWRVIMEAALAWWTQRQAQKAASRRNRPPRSPDVATIQETLAQVRAKYGPAPTRDECGAICNETAYWHRNDPEGWGVNQKTGGAYATRHDGQRIASDIIQSGATKEAYDCLVAAGDGGPATPAWNAVGQITDPARPWIAPIPPQGNPPDPPDPPDPPCRATARAKRSWRSSSRRSTPWRRRLWPCRTNWRWSRRSWKLSRASDGPSSSGSSAFRATAVSTPCPERLTELEARVTALETVLFRFLGAQAVALAPTLAHVKDLVGHGPQRTEPDTPLAPCQACGGTGCACSVSSS